MSLKKNVIASYVSQIYVTVISIVMVPLYLKYMGAEAYGLVGFFAMLQSWFNLLDMGLTPTVARETARFRGGAIDALSFRRLVRALEGIFLVIALIGACGLYFCAEFLASNWLQSTQLPLNEVVMAIKLMAIIIAMRWMCGLYRGAISGSEQIVWLSVCNFIIATLRFLGVLILLIYVGTTPTLFFSYQLGVAILELLVLWVQTYRILPAIPAGNRIPWSWEPLKPVLKFSLTIAFTSSVWVLLTQTDKLVLSKLLPLADYGYFTLAVLVAGGVSIVTGPISGAIMPRMAKLEAEGDKEGLISIYRQSTQLVAVIAGAACITLAFCAEPLLWAWTGDLTMAQKAGPILLLYAIGNGILSVSAFPYYLQYAKGDLKLHLIGNALFVVILIPTIIWAVKIFGGVGAGYVWLIMNLVYLVIWVPFVHKRFEPGLHLSWFGEDVLVIFFMSTLAGYAIYEVFLYLPKPINRGWQFVEIMILGVWVMLAGALSSSTVWTRITQWQQQKLQKHGA